MVKSVAVIGGGMSGLTLANGLKNSMSVTVFEKSRGLGGRMSTRRTETHQFDHGAQFFVARSRDFKRFVQSASKNGLVTPWEPRVMTIDPEHKPYTRPWFEPHYVGIPSMNSLIKALANNLTDAGGELRLATHATALRRDHNGWHLQLGDETEAGPFDWVVLTAPAPQCQDLLRDVPEAAHARDFLAPVIMQPCLAFMLTLKTPVSLSPTWQVAETNHSFLRWIADNSSKPGRPTSNAWVAHATPEWSQGHYDWEDEVLCIQATEELSRLTGVPASVMENRVVHRWRYARTQVPAEEASFLDNHARIGLCGDWCLGARVEAAYLSARDLEKRFCE